MKDFSKYTTLELVQYLLGEEYEKLLYRSSLAPFFLPEEAVRADPEKVGAATELIARWSDTGFLLPAPLSSPDLIRGYLRVYYAAQKCEGFTVLLLDEARQLAGKEEIYRGVISEARISVGAIVRRIIENRETAVLFVHHLPLGKAEPSSADIWLTTHLKNVLTILDITIVDYFVVVGNEPISLSERGLL